MAQTVQNWIVLITGFGQREGQQTGLEKLHDEVRRKCANASTVVLLKSWRDNPADLAERIFRWSDRYHRPRIVIVGYSYGGHTANLLARQLDRRGLVVDHLLLVDPVWRFFRFLPGLLSLLPVWELHLPANVRHCIAWRQNRDLPRGHAVEATGKTRLDRRPLFVDHNYADEAPDVLATAHFHACPRSDQ